MTNVSTEKRIFVPCPYCGGGGKRLSIGKKQLTPLHDPEFQVQCACGVHGPYGIDTEEAINLWNTLNKEK